jgi:leader peptidase (prepilin peptidase)/N-methyltransferase
MEYFTKPELIIIAIIFGLLIGSFISMLSWRLPRIMDLEAEEQFKQISISRSACSSCKKNLSWQQLFPIFSWLFSRGRCQNCKEKISIRYPLIEFVTASLTIYIFLTFGLTISGALALVFTYFLITLSIIDIEHHLILDKLSLPLMWIGLIASLSETFTTPEKSILGAVTGYMILWIIFYSFKIITGKEGMGFGDFKLLAALGAWFGISAIPQIILVSSLASIIIAIILSVIKIKDINTALPFGPFLAVGGMVTLIYGVLI